MHNITPQSENTHHCGPPSHAEEPVCLRAALECLALGWAPLPLCSHDHKGMPARHTRGKNPCRKPGKVPLVGDWQKKKLTEAELRSYWKDNPTANVGVALGPISGLVGLDIDGEAGKRLLEEWKQQGRELPPTITFETGGGGLRYLFALPEGADPKQKQWKSDDGAGNQVEAIRFQAKGGQTVMPPSIHVSGKPYAWLPRHAPDEVPIAECPPWLFELVAQEDEPERPTRGGGAQAPTTPGRPDVMTRVRAYLERIERPDRSPSNPQDATTQTLKAASVCIGFDLDLDTAVAVMGEWDTNRQFDVEEYRRKYNEAEKHQFDKGGTVRGSLLHAPIPNGQPTPPGQPDASQATTKTANLTDRGNAIRLVKAHGQEIRHCYPWNKWFAWDGTRWRIDDTGEVPRRAKRMLENLFEWTLEQMEQLRDEGSKAERSAELNKLQKLQSWCLRSEAAPRINAMLDLARSEDGIPILPEDMNHNPWLLNCINGTVDLRTGELRPHCPNDLLTKLCPTPYDPKVLAPRWLEFLSQIFAGDLDLVNYLQHLLGYSLTADISEQTLAIFHGAGANGKSVLVNTVLAVMGEDYTHAAMPDFLLDRHGDRHPTAIAALFGKRLLVCQETGAGRRLNEALVKWLTGGDRLTGRRMREDFWSFDPTHKSIMVTNYRPEVRGNDNGIWRRLRLIPFNITFPEEKQDKKLPQKLLAEAQGILRWLVQGAVEWSKGGMKTPNSVLQTTRAYRNDEDLFAQFLAECCLLGPGYQCRASELYTRFRQWHESRGEARPPTQRVFGEAMTAQGYGRKTNNGTWYVGIRPAA
jgi:putative DNA primase/helicase